MAKRQLASMSKLERARDLLVRGAVDDQDFRDVGLDPEEGRKIQEEILLETERAFAGSSPERVFARVTVETESHMASLAALKEDLCKQRQFQVAIGAVKAMHKVRKDWVEMGQELGLIKRAQSGNQVNVIVGDSALKGIVSSSVTKMQRLLAQMDTSLADFELPELGSKAPDMLSSERLVPARVLDAEPVVASKREVVDDEPFPGD